MSRTLCGRSVILGMLGCRLAQSERCGTCGSSAIHQHHDFSNFANYEKHRGKGRSRWYMYHCDSMVVVEQRSCLSAFSAAPKNVLSREWKIGALSFSRLQGSGVAFALKLHTMSTESLHHGHLVENKHNESLQSSTSLHTKKLRAIEML